MAYRSTGGDCLVISILKYLRDDFTGKGGHRYSSEQAKIFGSGRLLAVGWHPVWRGSKLERTEPYGEIFGVR
jgi:hypothetical protein